MKTIFFRTDAFAAMGYGHLIRCISLAGHIRTRGIVPRFILRKSEKQAEQLLDQHGFESIYISEEKELAAIVTAAGESLAVFDINSSALFGSDADYTKMLEQHRQNGIKLVSFEEFRDHPFASDLVIIPYIGAETLQLDKHTGTKYLLGPAYFVFSPEFMHAGRVQIREAVREVFICMGGSDPGLLTEQILGFLLHYPDSFNLHIVLARIDEDRRRQLENLLQQYHGSWELHINPPAISQVMLNADLGIINSGLIKYETSLLGLPCLSVSNDGSHESVMGLFAAARTIRHMGVAAALTEARFRQYFGFIAEERMERSQMAAASVSLFDTKGVARIFSEIQSLNN